MIYRRNPIRHTRCCGNPLYIIYNDDIITLVKCVIFFFKKKKCIVVLWKRRDPLHNHLLHSIFWQSNQENSADYSQRPYYGNTYNLYFQQVYDHDTFSADDIMGEAEIDLQPMITAAMAFGDPSRLGDMQIGRWFMTKDNALLHDSTVNIVAGKVKQELHLKLQNVESGEIELELQWVSLD
uniref:AGD13 n=1 Tax=Arundo donax TaxID=35708 RepID=A0A0A9DYU5_ARUDO